MKSVVSRFKLRLVDFKFCDHFDPGSANILVAIGIGCMYYYWNQNEKVHSNNTSAITSCQEISAQRHDDKANNNNNTHVELCCKEWSLWTVRMNLLLNKIGFTNIQMPEPRVLTSNDPVFAYPQLIQGLIQRSKDEQKLRNLSYAAKVAYESGDPTKVVHVMNQISQIAYGEGVTPQMRENFLIRYGCTGYTENILHYLVNLCRTKGIVEVAAGNGQWAKQLTDRYNTQEKQTITVVGSKRVWNFVLAFDDMTDLPLSPKIYHPSTQPAKEFFFPHVRKCSSHVDAVRRIECRGRVLLLVYPPPGPMALETVKAYIDAYPEGNDSVVYVGEGQGGANANDAFFDYFLNNGNGSCDQGDRWCLVKVMNVHPPLGGKGYEKVFVLKRLRKITRSN